MRAAAVVLALGLAGRALGDCGGKSEADCGADAACAWCKSAAVPSSCKSKEDA
eukprot:CAMPEP_0171195152 /NCGR_PEP_ID=MMETSP0790-20130122/21252_1 /TAXON_ID=2925 /ORGANISM="Alexandrium catenella, Strain OF101" /LENGTH=52 /DNA_ID=CAMNT_0011660361 /DNA_START=56 /DNA_END=211 /DNA_ORIENTATION=+